MYEKKKGLFLIFILLSVIAYCSGCSNETNNLIREPSKTSIPTASPTNNLTIRYSKNDIDISHSKSTTFIRNGESSAETLYVTTKKLKSANKVSPPININLKIGKYHANFISPWLNKVAIADFDKSDKYIDIYIISVENEASVNTTIFRYDGTSIKEFKIIYQSEIEFCYDGAGKIYYSYASSREYDRVLDYRTNHESRLTDQSLIEMLGEIK